MKLIGLVVRSYSSRWLRRWYWWHRLSKASIGRNVQVQFPLRLEGQGFLELGDHTVVEDDVTLLCGAGSEMRFGQGCVLERASVLQTGRGASLSFEKKCRVGSYTLICCLDRWVIGTGATIASYCQISARERGCHGRLIVGNKSLVGDHSLIDVSDDVSIGEWAAVGPHAIIYTHDHEYKHNHSFIWEGNIRKGKVTVETGAWVGARATILPGVTIGRRAVVAAGAVVTRSIPPGAVYGGVPAKPLSATGQHGV